MSDYVFMISLTACLAALAFAVAKAVQYQNQVKRMRRMIQAAPIPAFVIGRDHRVLYWGSAMEKISGIKGDQIVGTIRPEGKPKAVPITWKASRDPKTVVSIAQ